MQCRKCGGEFSCWGPEDDETIRLFNRGYCSRLCAEIADLTPSNDELLMLAEKYPAPPGWFMESDDPFAP